MKWKNKTVLRLGLLWLCIIFLLSPFCFKIPTVKAPTQEWRITTGTDDCGRWWKDGAPFGFSEDNDFFWCGDDTSSLWDYSSGMRFINIVIPQGSTINSANLTLMARPTYYETIPTTYIEGQDSDDTVTFSDGADYDARPRTSTNVAWTPTDWQTDVFYTSTDISTVIQEIVDREGWASGHSLVLFWRDTAGYGGSHKWLSAAAREYGLPDRASLKITWVNDENSVTLNSPYNEATETSYTVDFKFTPIFYQSIQNACLWTNETTWSCKQWNTTTVQNNIENTISETFSSEGTYIWNIRVFNSTYGLFAPANFTVTIEIPTPPPNYANYYESGDGNVIMHGGIQFKPNTIHTYIPQFNGRYKNITLDSGTLGLSKGTNAYEIVCSTNDNVTINLNKWFYSFQYNTEFQPNAETESSLTFTVNTRERGEPGGVTGVSTWSYNEDSTTVSLTCANYSKVSMWFLSDAEKQFEWITVRFPTWMGIAGFGLIFLSPVMIVYFIKQKEYETSMIIALIGPALGFAMIVVWFWG